MGNLLRTPLAWLVVGEFVVVGVLIIVAWNAFGSLANPVLASPSLLQPGAPADTAATPPGVHTVTKPGRGPLPGLNLNSDFWRVRLEHLNREQAYLEQLEWQLVHSALDAAQRYLQRVVIPSIERAEQQR